MNELHLTMFPNIFIAYKIKKVKNNVSEDFPLQESYHYTLFMRYIFIHGDPGNNKFLIPLVCTRRY